MRVLQVRRPVFSLESLTREHPRVQDGWAVGFLWRGQHTMAHGPPARCLWPLLCCVSRNLYSRPLNKAGVGGSTPAPGWKSVYNCRLRYNLTPKSPLLTGSLTNDISSQLITYFICCMCYIDCILTLKSTREKKMLRKSEGRENTNSQDRIIKNLYIIGPVQFLPVLFKGRL